MEKELNLTVSGETKELIIRHGQTIDPVKEKPIAIIGSIKAVTEFLSKRKLKINLDTANIQVDREKFSIILTLKEDKENRDFITARLIETEEFKNFAINKQDSWTSQELGEFIKMNRVYFEPRDVAGKLASQLLDFKVNATTIIEKFDDKKGNARILNQRAINEINIPSSFKLKIPIFKGIEAVEIEIELYINPNDFSILLISPEAAEITREVRDNAINDELKEIEKICPEIPIIEI